MIRGSDTAAASTTAPRRRNGSIHPPKKYAAMQPRSAKAARSDCCKLSTWCTQERRVAERCRGVGARSSRRDSAFLCSIATSDGALCL